MRRMPSGRSMQFKPITGVLLAVAVICVVIGIVYLVTAADNLPSIFPGHAAHATRHHVKHGIAFFALAAVAVIGAWFTTAPSGDSG